MFVQSVVPSNRTRRPGHCRGAAYSSSTSGPPGCYSVDVCASVADTVRMKAIIDRHGDIENPTVLSGHPMLIPAAEDAIKQWVY